ncbi:hypothetical protein EVAR_37497_1 [Eumeta japonica]|uniref:Secreted protein n=1 Tax=Eumeta variegata TaxID=151549 RepID=A0A4C1X9H3_EUMVA|nr:hypothetical protein EVAR_37497_1 [Eumeta japonica]
MIPILILFLIPIPMLFSVDDSSVLTYTHSAISPPIHCLSNHLAIHTPFNKQNNERHTCNCFPIKRLEIQFSRELIGYLNHRTATLEIRGA